MKGRIISAGYTLNRKMQITLELDESFRQEYDRLQGRDLDVTMKIWRNKRSLDANAYAWVLIDKIAAKLRVDKETVYRETIRNIGGVSDTVCVANAAADALTEAWTSRGIGWQVEPLSSKIPGCTNLVLYYGSSSYNVEQMSRMIDLLVQEAKGLGIETLSERELSLLKGQA